MYNFIYLEIYDKTKSTPEEKKNIIEKKDTISTMSNQSP
jgi:hypothetical protein